MRLEVGFDFDQPPSGARRTCRPKGIRELKPRGLILSGGPASGMGGSPCPHPRSSTWAPIRHLLRNAGRLSRLKEAASRRARREFGRTSCRVREPDGLFQGMPPQFTVWMSHGDRGRRPQLAVRFARRDRHLSLCGRASQDQTDLRPAISSRSNAHGTRRRAARQFRPEDLRLRSGDLADQSLIEQQIRNDQRARGKASGHLWAVGRSRFVGRRGAPCTGRSVRSCRAFSSTTECCGGWEERGGQASASASISKPICMSSTPGAVSFGVGGDLRTATEAQDHRPGVHRGLSQRGRIDRRRAVLGQGTLYPDVIESGGQPSMVRRRRSSAPQRRRSSRRARFRIDRAPAGSLQR